MLVPRASLRLCDTGGHADPPQNADAARCIVVCVNPQFRVLEVGPSTMLVGPGFLPGPSGDNENGTARGWAARARTSHKTTRNCARAPYSERARARARKSRVPIQSVGQQFKACTASTVADSVRAAGTAICPVDSNNACMNNGAGKCECTTGRWTTARREPVWRPE